MIRAILIATLIICSAPLRALDLSVPFASIDGGDLLLSDWKGQPVLLVNTASRCGFTGQYEGLQTLYDRYRDRGLIVVAVPSDDFNQELSSNEAVQEFCELTYGIDLPMTEISPVTGEDAHPVYAEIHAETGFSPRWYFNKVLIGPDGSVAATFTQRDRPLGRKIIRSVEALLP